MQILKYFTIKNPLPPKSLLMKNYTRLFAFVLCCFVSFSLQAVPVSVTSPAAVEEAATADALGSVTLEDLSHLSRQDIEARIGRKLRVSERVAVGILKRKAKRAAKQAARAAEGDGSETDGFAIAALVLGILSLLSGIVLGVLAIVFGIIAKRRIQEDPSLKGEGMAQAGFIMGIVSCALTVLLALLALLLLLATV
jgi:thiol:disulfide interchange protein